MTRTSWWPDRRPVSTPRQHLVGLLSVAGALAAPFVIDLLGGPPWRALWVLFGFGLGILVQVGMDAARPDPQDRVGVLVYRWVHLTAPLLACLLVLLVGSPFRYDA